MRLAAAALLLAVACAPTAPAPEVAQENWLLPGSQWRLVELGGAPFTQRVTATLTADGRVVGEAPCNRFTAAWSGRWPDLAFAPATATRRACPNLQAETEFFAVLDRIEHAALGADGLTLTGPDDAMLRFVRIA